MAAHEALQQARLILARVMEHLREFLEQEERLVGPAKHNHVVVGDDGVVVLLESNDRRADPLDDHAA
eukprot:scaffold120598_cov33-Phaeocystis_antarctica.AAC.2